MKLTTRQEEVINHFGVNTDGMHRNSHFRPANALVKKGLITINDSNKYYVWCSLTEAGREYYNANNLVKIDVETVRVHTTFEFDCPMDQEIHISRVYVRTVGGKTLVLKHEFFFDGTGVNAQVVADKIAAKGEIDLGKWR